MVASGKPQSGSPLARLAAELHSASIPVVRVMAGDVLDVCGFVADEKATAKLSEVALAAIEKEQRSGAVVAVKAADLKALVDLAIKK